MINWKHPKEFFLDSLVLDALHKTNFGDSASTECVHIHTFKLTVIISGRVRGPLVSYYWAPKVPTLQYPHEHFLFPMINDTITPYLLHYTPLGTIRLLATLL